MNNPKPALTVSALPIRVLQEAVTEAQIALDEGNGTAEDVEQIKAAISVLSASAVSAEPVAWAVWWPGKQKIGGLFVTRTAAHEAATATNCRARPLVWGDTAPPPAAKAAEPVDDNSLRALISEAGNRAHNLSCEHQNNEDLARRLGDLAVYLWGLAGKASAATPPVSVEAVLADRYTVETFPLPRTSEFQPTLNNGIRITDNETGRMVEVSSERAAHANAAKAWEQIKAHPVEASQQQARPCGGPEFVGHSVERGGYCVYAPAEGGDYVAVSGPFGNREEADASLAQLSQQQQASDVQREAARTERFLRDIDAAVAEAVAEPASGKVLHRFGITWQGTELPIAVPMPDGYWTPWHYAQAELSRLAAEMSAAKAEAEAMWQALDYAVTQVPSLATVPGIAAIIAAKQGKGGEG